MSKPTIAIVGPSGSGKSTSLRNLDPASTEIIDCEMKGFPFRNAERFNITSAGTCAAFDTAFKAALDKPTTKLIIIESFTKYNEMSLQMAAMVNNNDGFKTYAQLEKMTSTFLNRLKNDKAIVVVTGIDEIVKIPNTDGTESAVRRMATKGRSWEGKIEKEFLAVLFTQVVKDKEGNMQYMFQTNTDGVTSAKTPMEMFASKLIPNDLAEVIKVMDKYYAK